MQKRNVFLFQIKFVPSKESMQKQSVEFTGGYGLKSTISQQNGNSIDDGITPPAALAA
jgi:hypothetical protein